MPERLTDGYRKARKDHSCWVCGPGHIKSGDRYYCSTSVFDGRVYTLKFCTPCQTFTDVVWEWTCGHMDEGIFPDDYIECAHEYKDHPVHGPEARALLERIEQ